MRELFESWNPRPEAEKQVSQCNTIIAEYQAQGLKLTLRQLYYQLVSRDLLSNTERSYKNLGTVLGKARMAGLVDWNAIEDRGRVAQQPTEFESLDQLVEAALRAYRLPRLREQENYVELWVERQALAGVLEPVARDLEPRWSLWRSDELH